MQAATELETAETDSPVLTSNPIAEEAERILGESAYSDLRHLTCDYQGGVISIRGRLPSYYLKQVAQAAVCRIEGVQRVLNEIQVF
jgi:osmotically-inducible protein OsmY